jgi:hypothetical protein
MPPGLQFQASEPMLDREKRSKKDEKPGIQGDFKYGKIQEGDLAVKGHGDSNRFSPNDVRQGKLGNCYFMASLMAIAKSHPRVLQTNIDGPLSNGTYNVILFSRNTFGGWEPKTYNVEPRFPMQKGDPSKFAYAQPGDLDGAYETEIWVMLYEKAFAQRQGSYKNSDRGFEEDALEAITGQEHTRFSFSGGVAEIGRWSEKEIQHGIQKHLKSGMPVTAGTHMQVFMDHSSEAKFARENRIIGKHAYAVMSANATHITVRNPWGEPKAEVTMTWKQFRNLFADYTTR